MSARGRGAHPRRRAGRCRRRKRRRATRSRPVHRARLGLLDAGVGSLQRRPRPATKSVRRDLLVDGGAARVLPSKPGEHADRPCEPAPMRRVVTVLIVLILVLGALIAYRLWSQARALTAAPSGGRARSKGRWSSCRRAGRGPRPGGEGPRGAGGEGRRRAAAPRLRRPCGRARAEAEARLAASQAQAAAAMAQVKASQRPGRRGRGGGGRPGAGGALAQAEAAERHAQRPRSCRRTSPRRASTRRRRARRSSRSRPWPRRRRPPRAPSRPGQRPSPPGGRLAGVQAALAQVRAAEASVARARLLAAECELRAPRDAEVQTLPHEAGELVSPGATLVRLVDLIGGDGDVLPAERGDRRRGSRARRPRWSPTPGRTTCSRAPSGPCRSRRSSPCATSRPARIATAWSIPSRSW